LKILLDTTYFMPAIGISVKEIPNDAVIKLLKRGEDLAISEMSIFELAAKGAKYSSFGKIPLEKVQSGVKAVNANDRVAKLPLYEEEQLKIAISIRRFLKDFIDCLILSSALIHCETLVTEDRSVLDLRENETYKRLLTTYNSGFRVQNFAHVLASKP
jgi:PIN domain nuclease of toxin-antitoxin system